jgi:hypothetical protein
VEGRVVGPSIQALAEEVQQTKGDLATHTAVCTERYEAQRTASEELKASLGAVMARLGAISDAQIASASASAAVASVALTNNRPKWWQQLVGGAVLALFGWMAATIWNMETAKIDAMQNHLAASVTVNPAQAPAAVPAPIIVSPPTPAPDQVQPSTN